MSAPGLWARIKRRAEQLATPPPDIDFVTESLAVGGAVTDERQWRVLAGMGIGAVLDLRAEDVDDAVLLAEHGMHLLHLPTEDWHPPGQDELARATDWVIEQMSDGRKTLIHCGHGIGRSVIVTAAVLVCMGFPWQEAMRIIQRKRPRAGPRDSQLAALAEFARGRRAGPQQ